MHIAALSLAGAIGLATSAVAANAAPVLPSALGPQASNVIQVAGGCGGGFHPNRFGRCVPDRFVGYYRPRPYAWDYSGGGYYGPWNRPSPSDHVANQLNRQALYGWGY